MAAVTCENLINRTQFGRSLRTVAFSYQLFNALKMRSRNLQYVFVVVLCVCLLATLSGVYRTDLLWTWQWPSLTDLQLTTNRLNSQFQVLNDNFTYVYAGYYDDREEEAEVKVVALLLENTPYNFTCTVSYHNNAAVTVEGYAKYLLTHAKGPSFYHVGGYRDGYVICPVNKKLGPPTGLSLQKAGLTVSRTVVAMWPAPTKTSKLTRCVSPLINSYSDVSELISNIEYHRLFGVEKFVMYVESVSEKVKNVLLSYARDGIVELRNFTISAPREDLSKVMMKKKYWGQWLSYHDCLLSQMYSAKYVLFGDLDEIVVPRMYSTLWEMADDLFSNISQHWGSLEFTNVFYPRCMNKTRAKFPDKDLALRYSIYPLLYTTRLYTANLRLQHKCLVRPLTIDTMWIHYVDAFKKGWRELLVAEHVAVIQHYRLNLIGGVNYPQTEDSYMLNYSHIIIPAFQKRLDKL